MIVDVHAHAFPDPLATRAIESLAQRSGLPLPNIEGTVTELLDSMSEAGIDHCFLANIATRPEQAGAILEWSRTIRSDRITPLGSLHPDSPTWQSDLEAIGRAGLPGIKFHPQYQGFAADAPRLIPIYRAIARSGLFVLIHGGFDPAFPGDDRAAPSRLAQVLAQVPDLTLIAAHLGGYQAWDEVIDCLVGTQAYFDTSFMDEATQAQRTAIFGRHDPTRIVFGSDCPWNRQSEALELIRRLPLDESVRRAILGGNAVAMLTRLSAKRQSGDLPSTSD